MTNRGELLTQTSALKTKTQGCRQTKNLSNQPEKEVGNIAHNYAAQRSQVGELLVPDTLFRQLLDRVEYS